MKWEKNLYHVESCGHEFVGFFKFETGELFPGPHFEKFQVMPTSPRSEDEAINLLNAKAEAFLKELNNQAEREQEEFEKHFEEFCRNVTGPCLALGHASN